MTWEFTNGPPQRLPAYNFLSQYYFYTIFLQKSCRFSLQNLAKFEAAKTGNGADFCVWPLCALAHIRFPVLRAGNMYLSRLLIGHWTAFVCDWPGWVWFTTLNWKLLFAVKQAETLIYEGVQGLVAKRSKEFEILSSLVRVIWHLVLFSASWMTNEFT